MVRALKAQEMKFPMANDDPKSPHDHDSEYHATKDPENSLEMMWTVTKLSVGPIVSMFFYMFVQLINTYYIGHQNDSTLIAGVGMGNMLINVLAFAIMQGLNGALETLISRKYGQSKDPTKSEF